MANDLGFELKAILEAYNEEVQQKVDTAMKSVAKEAVQKLKGTSPVDEGEYAKGWANKVERRGLIATVTVYNKAKPGLTHLLENGHAKVNGGRVAARSHIKPVEEWANAELVRRIEEALS